MAAINHTALKAPLTQVETLDGTTQQVQFPPNTRCVSIRFRTNAGNYMYESHDGSGGELISQPVDVWYSHPIAEGQATPSGARSYIYVSGTLGSPVDIEYSVVGGR